ncbi:MAG: BrnT family toxin [Geminicoccales bacterium]
MSLEPTSQREPGVVVLMPRARRCPGLAITWDEMKRRRTLVERGLDLADAEKVFAGNRYTRLDDRRDYGEPRYGRFVVIAWTPRGGRRRIIEGFDTAAYYEGDKLVRRGRPRSDAPKEAVSLRLDPLLCPGWTE